MRNIANTHSTRVRMCINHVPSDRECIFYLFEEWSRKIWENYKLNEEESCQVNKNRDASANETYWSKNLEKPNLMPDVSTMALFGPGVT